jgi:hydroxymethylbilane synthase
MLITTAERAFLKSMEGGCQIPIGCFSEVIGQKISFTGLVADLTGERVIKKTLNGNLELAEKIALEVSEQMIAKGATEILDEIRDNLG